MTMRMRVTALVNMFMPMREDMHVPVVPRACTLHLAHRRPLVERLRHRPQALQVGRRQHPRRRPPAHQLARQHQRFGESLAHLVQVV